MTSSPTANTTVGHDAMEPLMPSPTGTVVLAASGSLRHDPFCFCLVVEPTDVVDEMGE